MITREEMREIAAKYGIKEAPRDHPIYREPPTIRFVSKPLKPNKCDDSGSKQRTYLPDLHTLKLAMVDEEVRRQMNIGMGLEHKPEQVKE